MKEYFIDVLVLERMQHLLANHRGLLIHIVQFGTTELMHWKENRRIPPNDAPVDPTVSEESDFVDLDTITNLSWILILCQQHIWHNGAAEYEGDSELLPGDFLILYFF